MTAVTDALDILNTNVSDLLVNVLATKETFEASEANVVALAAQVAIDTDLVAGDLIIVIAERAAAENAAATAADDAAALVVADLTAETDADRLAAAGSATDALNSANAAAASAATAAVVANIASVQLFTSPLAKAIRVALLASASVRTLQVLDDADIDMGTNNFSVVVQKRITTTRPAANEILYHKHDGTTGVIVTLLTTGIVRLTLNATTFDSTVALTSASNVEPVIIIPVVRETTTAAGSVTFVVDGVQLGTALVISARVEKIVNGGFASDITGWTFSGSGSAVWNAGKLLVERINSPDASAYQAISLAAGETLFVTANLTFGSGSGTTDARLVLRTGTALNSGTELVGGTYIVNTASGVSSLSYYSATAQTVYLHCRVYAVGTGSYNFDTITSIDAHSVDNASNLYALGTSSTTTEGDYYDGAIYNRALSVTECLNYCLRGPDVTDIGASQAAKITIDFTDSVGGFSGVNGMTVAAVDGIFGRDNVLSMTSDGSSSSRARRSTFGAYLFRKTKVTFMAARAVGNVTATGVLIALTASGSDSIDASEYFQISASGAWESFESRLLALASEDSGRRIAMYPVTAGNIATVTNGDIIYIDDLATYKLGITGHWPAFNAQTNTGQLADRSGNKNHMLLPASGATILGDRRPDVQFTWENTWAATSELQYFPGVNQACYPTNFYIEGIIITPSATTTAGFTIGNGSDADYYATVSGPLTAGVPVFVPLTNRYSDGTNLKLTITPMATTTCTLSTTVFGRLLGGF